MSPEEHAERERLDQTLDALLAITAAAIAAEGRNAQAQPKLKPQAHMHADWTRRSAA